jgi:hypothetical protein
MKKNLSGYNQASVHIPFCIVTDLDNGECAPSLINEWTANMTINKNLILRVAVREIEAWIMSDRQGFSKFSGVPLKHVPEEPEKISDPKSTLLNIVAKYGKKMIRQDLLPRNSYSSIGPNYNLTLSEFVFHAWNVQRARKNSRSLEKMMHHLNRFTIA